MVAEIEVETKDFATAEAEALGKLDAFREAANPSAEYGITLYQARPADVGELVTPRRVLAVTED
jgi:hypothetical protein